MKNYLKLIILLLMRSVQVSRLSQGGLFYSRLQPGC